MGENTIGVIQKFSTVPGGKPNAGDDAIEDATDIDSYIKRELNILNVKATEIVANSNMLDVSSSKKIIIEMDSNITDLELTGLDLVTDFNTEMVACNIEFVQDIIGGRTITTGGSILYSVDFGEIGLSGTAGKVDIAGFLYNKILDKYMTVSFSKGFN